MSVNKVILVGNDVVYSKKYIDEVLCSKQGYNNSEFHVDNKKSYMKFHYLLVHKCFTNIITSIGSPRGG